MNAVKATWKNGQVILERPASWPEGRRLVVIEESLPPIEFMTEDEQSDDPKSIEQWISDLRALPPLEMSPEKEAELLAWQQKVKQFNLEAVRQQMEGTL